MDLAVKELFILHFLNDGIRSTFVSLLPFIAKDFKLNLGLVGFLGSAQPLLATILAIPASFFAARIGSFKLLIYLLIIYSLGAFLAFLAPNFILITLAFLLAATGFGMFHTVSFTLVGRESSGEQMGKNMGNFTSIGDVGRILIPPVAVFLVSVSSWRVSMLLLSVLGFLIFIFIKVTRVKKIESKIYQKSESHTQFIKQLIEIIKSRKMILTLIAGILDSLASSPIFIFLPFLLFTKGITIQEYAFIVGFYSGGSLIGKYVLGRGVDKFGNLKIFIFSEICMGLALIFLTVSNHLLLIFFITLVLGLFTRGTTPVITSMFSQVSHKGHYDKIFALSEMFIGFAAMVTVTGMGIIADRIGVYFVFYTASVLAVLATIPAVILYKKFNS